MKRLGTKTNGFKPLGGKNMNRAMKFGSKALNIVGDLTPLAFAFAPPVAPILETAKLAGIGLGALQKSKQLAKHKF